MASPDTEARLAYLRASNSMVDRGRISLRGTAAGQQPVTTDDCAVTFWKYLPQDGPKPVPADLGRLLRNLHGLRSPPIALPAYRPLVSVRRAIASSRAIEEDQRAWLGERCDQLLDAYGQLSFELPGWDDPW